MAAEIIKQNPLRSVKNEMFYEPVFVVIKKKIYPVSEWHEALKLLMYSYCFQGNKMDLIQNEMNRKDPKFHTVLFSDRYNETTLYTKFAPDTTIRVFRNDADNCRLLNKLYKQLGKFDFYIFRTDTSNLKEDRKKALIRKKKQELTEKYHYKNGSTKHLIAHINGKCLNNEEKFYRRTEKEFDKAVLIGDVNISPSEEQYLKEYMSGALKQLIRRNTSLNHDKLFAVGMVKAAMKHYSAKTFWPYLAREYDVSIPINIQAVINKKFREILKRYKKAYDDNTSNYVQNICMHAFVCDKCADQFFDYMFEFWRLDLSRSIENMTDSDGVNLFNILIDEIKGNYNGFNVNDVMMHTTMALIKNPRGCKNRFRHILRLIDCSYWNGTDFAGSTNRITNLFNEWKNRENGTFQTELKRTAEGRKAGRGEKLLSRPVITFNAAKAEFSLLMPKQILRHCSEEEHPVWIISCNGFEYTVEPVLMRGKSSLFTEECTLELSRADLFREIEIILKSDRRVYSRRIIREDDVRFFSKSDRNMEVAGGTVARDISYAFVKTGKKLTCLNPRAISIREFNKRMDLYNLNAAIGDVFIMPDRRAVSVGKPMTEGIIGRSRQSGVIAYYEDEPYEIASDRESIFFRAKKRQLNGTSLRIIQNGEEIYFGKLDFEKLVEFRLYDEADDIYGYSADMHDYIGQNGIYDIQLSIPKLPDKSYKLCYIRHFRYVFEDAPYIFEETGTISVPSEMDFVLDDAWEVNGSKKKLTFSLNESGKDINKYVSDRKLRLQYSFGKAKVNLVFDLPVFYWRYSPNAEWNYKKPEEGSASKLPANIYIGGDLNLAEAKLILTGNKLVEETEVPVNHNVDKDLYYFRTVDFREYLTRDMIMRILMLNINGTEAEFTRVLCRSFVASQNITGDFERNVIYGNFDIIGQSEYMATIWFGKTVLEEDIPIKKGQFEVHCDVVEGDYTVVVYELEDDGIGFGAVSYEIGRYHLHLRDVNSLTGNDLLVRSIQDRKGRFAKINLFEGYIIRNLKKLNYARDVADQLEIPTYLYHSDIESEMSRFSYYRGRLLRSIEKGYRICEVLIVFDNPENMGEALIFELTEDDVQPLALNVQSGRLIASSSLSTRKFSSQLGRTITFIDDDLYRISVEVRE